MQKGVDRTMKDNYFTEEGEQYVCAKCHTIIHCGSPAILRALCHQEGIEA